VLGEYVAQLVGEGYSIEYFIEGGRSRTGRLLKPKGGMIAMTLRAFLRAPRRPVVFQPVYIGYEKLIEGKSYLGELSGQPKVKESWWTLVRSLSVLRHRYGRVAVNFGEPIDLAVFLDTYAAGWRERLGEDGKITWLCVAAPEPVGGCRHHHVRSVAAEREQVGRRHLRQRRGGERHGGVRTLQAVAPLAFRLVHARIRDLAQALRLLVAELCASLAAAGAGASRARRALRAHSFPTRTRAASRGSASRRARRPS